jgi:MT-A70 protein
VTLPFLLPSSSDHSRANPEQCLFATRGKPRRKAKDVRRLVVERRREYSRKPDCVRERIERLVAGPYLELFARETKRGWDCWGDQVSLFDTGSVVTRRQPSRLVDACQEVAHQIRSKVQAQPPSDGRDQATETAR